MSEGCVGVGSGVCWFVGLSPLCTVVVLSGWVVGARVGGPAFEVFIPFWSTTGAQAVVVTMRL